MGAANESRTNWARLARAPENDQSTPTSDATLLVERHNRSMTRALPFRLGTLLVAVVACTGAASASVTASGLYGIVEKGPIRPVCQVGQPCDAPAQVTLLFSRTTATGTLLSPARSKATGAYRIGLTPGYYTVTTKERIGIRHNIRPSRVHVRAGHWDRINFFIDTGIR